MGIDELRKLDDVVAMGLTLVNGPALGRIQQTASVASVAGWMGHGYGHGYGHGHRHGVSKIGLPEYRTSAS